MENKFFLEQKKQKLFSLLFVICAILLKEAYSPNFIFWMRSTYISVRIYTNCIQNFQLPNWNESHFVPASQTVIISAFPSIHPNSFLQENAVWFSDYNILSIRRVGLRMLFSPPTEHMFGKMYANKYIYLK